MSHKGVFFQFIWDIEDEKHVKLGLSCGLIFIFYCTGFVANGLALSLSYMVLGWNKLLSILILTTSAKSFVGNKCYAFVCQHFAYKSNHAIQLNPIYLKMTEHMCFVLCDCNGCNA